MICLAFLVGPPRHFMTRFQQRDQFIFMAHKYNEWCICSIQYLTLGRLSKMVYNAGYSEVFSSCTLKMLFQQGVFLYKEIDRVFKERKFGFKLNAQVKVSYKVSLEARPPGNLGF